MSSDLVPWQSAVDLAESLGVSYRQLDYWSVQGWIFDDARAAVPGSGYARTLSPDESARFAIMARLVRAGMKPRAASQLARELHEKGVAQMAGLTLHMGTRMAS